MFSHRNRPGRPVKHSRTNFQSQLSPAVPFSSVAQNIYFRRQDTLAVNLLGDLSKSQPRDSWIYFLGNTANGIEHRAPCFRYTEFNTSYFKKTAQAAEFSCAIQGRHRDWLPVHVHQHGFFKQTPVRCHLKHLSGTDRTAGCLLPIFAEFYLHCTARQEQLVPFTHILLLTQREADKSRSFSYSSPAAFPPPRQC